MRRGQVQRRATVERIALRSLEPKISQQTKSARIETVHVVDSPSQSQIGSTIGDEIRRKVRAVDRKVRLHGRSAFLLDKRPPVDPRSGKRSVATPRQFCASGAIVEA